MGDSKISGDVIITGAGGSTGSGSKDEIKATYKFKSFDLELHTELKTGLDQQEESSLLIDENGDTKTIKPQDWFVKGIYKEETAFAVIKGLAASKKYESGLQLKIGEIDVGRDLTTNGFGRLGLAQAGSDLRTPYAFFVERPNNLFPGSNLGGFVEKSAKKEDVSYRLFAGVTNGRKSSGLLGVRVKEGEQTPIAPSGTDDPFLQGAFLTLGGGVATAIPAQKLVIGADASVSILTQPEKAPRVMGYGSVALDLDKRFTLAADVSLIQEQENLDSRQLSVRGIADVAVVKNDKGSVSLFGAFIKTTVPGGSIPADEGFVDQGEDTVIIGADEQPFPVLEKDFGQSFVGGVRGEYKKSKTLTIEASVDAGVMSDDRLPDNVPVVDGRLSLRWKFGGVNLAPKETAKPLPEALPTTTPASVPVILPATIPVAPAATQPASQPVKPVNATSVNNQTPLNTSPKKTQNTVKENKVDPNKPKKKKHNATGE